MDLWQLSLIIVVVLSALGVVVWWLIRTPSNPDKNLSHSKQPLRQMAEEDVAHIFNDKFREELRNRGRLHFEKIITENAMFLQQDLRLTTSQLNEYMKQEITRTLKEEFSKYEQSITDAKQIAIDSIEKTRVAIEQQREILGTQLEKELQEEKARYTERLENNMAEIINHYILSAVGDQISLDDQLEYILGQLEDNKKEILEDIKNGA